MRPSKAPPAAAASADGADSAPSTSGAFVSSGTAFRYSDITALDEAWAFLVQLTVAGGSGARWPSARARLRGRLLLLHFLRAQQRAALACCGAALLRRRLLWRPHAAALADGRGPSSSFCCVCGMGAGAIARTAVAPLERVKLLLQVQHLANSNGGGSRGAAAARPPYQGMLDALRRIPQEQGGWRALYRGNGANVLRLLPEVGFFKFVVHDQASSSPRCSSKPICSANCLLLAWLGIRRSWFKLRVVWIVAACRPPRAALA